MAFAMSITANVKNSGKKRDQYFALSSGKFLIGTVKFQAVIIIRLSINKCTVCNYFSPKGFHNLFYLILIKKCIKLVNKFVITLFRPAMCIISLTEYTYVYINFYMPT